MPIEVSGYDSSRVNARQPSGHEARAPAAAGVDWGHAVFRDSMGTHQSFRLRFRLAATAEEARQLSSACKELIQIGAQGDREAQLARAVAMLRDLMLDWRTEYDDGSPVPFTPENVDAAVAEPLFVVAALSAFLAVAKKAARKVRRQRRRAWP